MVNDSDKGFLNTTCEIINLFFTTRSDANLVQIGITVYKWNNVLVVVVLQSNRSVCYKHFQPKRGKSIALNFLLLLSDHLG
jgi:hypothetical protein